MCKISFDSVVGYFRLNCTAHDGTLMCIGAHSCREIAKNQLIAILLCLIYANYRNPTRYSQRASHIKSPVASYSSGGRIFGSFPIEALRITFRKENPVDL